MQISPTSSPLGLTDLLAPSIPPSHYQRAQTFGSLCHWWSQTKDEALPSICHQFLQVHPDHLHQLLSLKDDSYGKINGSLNQHKLKVLERGSLSKDHPLYSGRSISLVGILGGVLFILLLIAFITCIRQRKRYQEHEAPINNHLSNHLRRYVRQLQASQELMEQIAASEQSRVPPPDYVSVIKQKEKEEMELPSYSQALSRKEGEGEPSESEETVIEWTEEKAVVESETEGHRRESPSH